MYIHTNIYICVQTHINTHPEWGGLCLYRQSHWLERWLGDRNRNVVKKLASLFTVCSLKWLMPINILLGKTVQSGKGKFSKLCAVTSMPDAKCANECASREKNSIHDMNVYRFLWYCLFWKDKLSGRSLRNIKTIFIPLFRTQNSFFSLWMCFVFHYSCISPFI